MHVWMDVRVQRAGINTRTYTQTGSETNKHSGNMDRVT